MTPDDPTHRPRKAPRSGTAFPFPGPAPGRSALRAAALVGLVGLGACWPFGGSDPEPAAPGPADSPAGEADAGAEVPDSVGLAADTAPAPPTPPPPDTRSWAERTLDELTLRQKVAQMIMPVVLGDFAPEGTPGHDRIVRMVERQEVGGVIVSVGSPTDVAVKLNDLQRHARVPLLVAADLETGAGFRLRGAVHSPTNIVLGGATDFPSLMALGATGDAGLAYEMGRITAVEARAVGIHVPFAPVLDVNNNPDNPIINVRSFGEDPEHVALLGSAFVRGVEEHGGLATGKHFPGHGDTEVDSHLELPVIRVERGRLDAVELRPFQAAIDMGMGGIMTAHIAVPSINGGNGDPATLSRPILTDLLRDEMGFRGLLFTDAMDMRAIDRAYPRGEAAVRAVDAGADIVLMPPSVPDAISALVNAVHSGRLSEARIDASVRRILDAKARMGLHRDRTVNVDQVVGTVGVPEHLEVATEIARRSITVLKNGRDLLPLQGTRSARVLSVTYRRENDRLAGRYFDGRLGARYPRLTRVEVGRDTEEEVYDGLLRRARSSNLVVVSLYVTAVSYSGSVAVEEDMADFIEALAAARIPHVVVSFGNPYLLREFPEAQAYVLAWSGAEVSQRAAAAALFGEFDVTGTTPTRIPPFFEIGAGIRIPAEGTTSGG